MPYEYNQLLKLNLQKKADLDPVEADIDDLKQKKVTKFFDATDTLEGGEIAQYQGPDDAVNGLKNGYFYNTSGQITIQTGTPFIEIPADIVGEFSTIKAGKYYLTDTEAVTLLHYRLARDGNNNDYILCREGSSIDLPVVGDIVCKKAYTYNENSTYYKIASVSWVTGNTYDLTLTNGDALTITLDSAGGSYSYLHEFQNNDGKIFLYQKTASYSNWSPVLFCDTENNNAVIYAPYVTAGTTDTEVIINGGFAQVDTQPRVEGVENAQDGSLIITRDVQFSGDITVQGTQTIVDTQQIDSENDFINLRYNNPTALADGDTSGISVKNYDGNDNNLQLVVDNKGWARVGDEDGTLQKLATIEETPTDGAFVKYNNTTKQLESGTIPTPAEATTTTAGLMSAADKVKLNGIETGAQVNPTVSTTTQSGIYCAKYGRLCFLTGSISSGGNTITLPAAYKPANWVYFTAVGSASTTAIFICAGSINPTTGGLSFSKPILSISGNTITFNPTSFPISFSVAYLAAS